MDSKDNRISIDCTIERVKYYQETFGIVYVYVDKVNEGKPILDKNGCLTIKGDMPNPKEGEGYSVVAVYTPDTKWGDQYTVEIMTSSVNLDESDPSSKKKFLKQLFTDRQVSNMYKALKDPFTALKEGDMQSLVKIKGCAIARAEEWVSRFKANYYLIKIYAELGNYNLSYAIINKLLDRYKSPDLVIEKVTNNPYVLITEVKGIGWETADKIALAGGMDENDPKRIGAYIYNYLTIWMEKGYSYVSDGDILSIVLDQFGKDIPDEVITNGLLQIESKVWRNKEKQLIGLKWVYELENKIAKELIRLRNAESDLKAENWQDAVKRIEGLQGWQYTDEQIEGLKVILDNNVALIQGGSGTGKSSLVAAMIECFKGRSFAQCALSGKAASRLMEITHKEGYTIHRLLGYPLGPSEKGKYTYHDENQLGYDIIILDEISMVNLEVFYALIRSIKSGSKLICLGDNGQLESIGTGNLAYDILHSPEIPSVVLTKIHRQAENSAIVTESVKVRDGIQLAPSDWVGTEVRGNLKDLELTCYSDRNNTYSRIIAAYTNLLHQGIPVTDIQVIAPNRFKGMGSVFSLNNLLQEIYNPHKSKQKEITLTAIKGCNYVLRVGDKVINTVNNYKTNPNIFNGNIGIVKQFFVDEEDEEYMIIDFDEIGEVKVPKEFWRNIELGYVLTVHKSQGSEWDYVIFGMDYGAYTLLSKELVYTAMTRAKKKCFVFAENRALRQAISQSSIQYKQTHLQQCLYDAAHPKLIF